MHGQDHVRLWFGWAELSPADPIVAGSLGRWKVIYHTGRYGVAAGGSLKLLFHAAGDWPALQGRDPYEESFLTVRAEGPARLAWRYDPRGHARPWSKAVIVDVAQWGLAAGETVTFDLGDPEGGSPGVRAQTCAQRGHELRVVVDPFGSGRHVAVPSPTVDIVAGQATRVALVVPSRVAAGEPFALTVRLEDRWGNVARSYSGRVALEGLPGISAVELAAGDGGVRRIGGLRLVEPGLYRVRGREAVLGIAGESNPLQVQRAGEGALVPLWGDLQAEAPNPEAPGSAAEYLDFARDAAALDYCAHQLSDRELAPALWQTLQDAADAADEPGRFVALVGYRWTANTCGGGVRQVLCAGTPPPLHTSAAALDGDGTADACSSLAALHEALRGGQALLVVGGRGPAASLDGHDATLEPLLEIHSGWGEPRWLLEEALERGCHLGFAASSGDPLGRPGASWPGAGDRVARGGLTCALASARTREAVCEALRARRCYATSGPRILLDVTADGHTLGEAYQAARPPEIRVRVAATEEIEVVEIRRGAEIAYRCPEEDAGRPGWLRVAWGGAMARDWPRHTPWDGTLRCQGARIVRAVPYGFDSPARGIVLSGEDALSWRSVTAGNENGLDLELDAAPGATLALCVPMADLTVPLDELPFEKALGGEGLYVRVAPRPRGTSRRELDLAWSDDALRPGTTPYYVVVRQADGARAWSSPIFVSGRDA